MGDAATAGAEAMVAVVGAAMLAVPELVAAAVDDVEEPPQGVIARAHDTSAAGVAAGVSAAQPGKGLP